MNLTMRSKLKELSLRCCYYLGLLGSLLLILVTGFYLSLNLSAKPSEVFVRELLRKRDPSQNFDFVVYQKAKRDVFNPPNSYSLHEVYIMNPEEAAIHKDNLIFRGSLAPKNIQWINHNHLLVEREDQDLLEVFRPLWKNKVFVELR